MIPTFHIYSQDSFNRAVLIRDDTGTPKDMSLATAVAFAMKGNVVVPGSVSMSDSVDGIIGFAFASGSLSIGEWEVHLRISYQGDVRTVAIPLNVRKGAM